MAQADRATWRSEGAANPEGLTDDISLKNFPTADASATDMVRTWYAAKEAAEMPKVSAAATASSLNAVTADGPQAPNASKARGTKRCPMSWAERRYLSRLAFSENLAVNREVVAARSA